jgi:multidrug/hemolysin transport system permease protein
MMLYRLVKRNVLVYSRDRSNIFFSLLSMLVIIGLMVIFLGKMNADGVVDLLNEYGGLRDTVQDRANAEQLVMLWTLAGIVVVNSVTITLTMVGIMVEDEAQKRLSSFFVAPVKRGVFALSYIIAAFIMGIIICSLTVIIGELSFAAIGGTLLSVKTFIQVFIYIILIVFVSSGMVFLIANFVHSQSAFSGASVIIGTLIGFLAAIYLPMGMLPARVQTILKCFPLLHGCSFLRSVLTEQILKETFVNCPAEVLDGYKEYMGITILKDGTVISNTTQVAFLIISGIIFIGVAAILQRKRNVMSR